MGIYEPNGRALLDDHLAKKTNYEEFTKASVKQWKGMRVADFERVINEIPLRDSALDVLNYFKNHGYRVACVSSGFDFWKSVFEKKHGFIFDEYFANHVIVDENGILTGEVDVNVTDDTPLKNKGEQLKKLCDKFNIRPDESIMVGDGLGDIKAFNLADVSFAVDPTHDEVALSADHAILGDSLSEILDYFKDGCYCPPEKKI